MSYSYISQTYYTVSTAIFLCLAAKGLGTPEGLRNLSDTWIQFSPPNNRGDINNCPELNHRYMARSITNQIIDAKINHRHVLIQSAVPGSQKFHYAIAAAIEHKKKKTQHHPTTHVCLDGSDQVSLTASLQSFATTLGCQHTHTDPLPYIAEQLKRRPDADILIKCANDTTLATIQKIHHKLKWTSASLLMTSAAPSVHSWAKQEAFGIVTLTGAVTNHDLKTILDQHPHTTGFALSDLTFTLEHIHHDPAILKHLVAALLRSPYPRDYWKYLAQADTPPHWTIMQDLLASTQPETRAILAIIAPPHTKQTGIPLSDVIQQVRLHFAGLTNDECLSLVSDGVRELEDRQIAEVDHQGYIWPTLPLPIQNQLPDLEEQCLSQPAPTNYFIGQLFRQVTDKPAKERASSSFI